MSRQDLARTRRLGAARALLLSGLAADLYEALRLGAENDAWVHDQVWAAVKAQNRLAALKGCLKDAALLIREAEALDVLDTITRALAPCA